MKGINLTSVFLGFIATFLFGVVLLQLRVVLLPFAIALLLSILFKPIVLYAKQRRIPTAIALLVVLISFAAVLFLIGMALYSSAGPFLSRLPTYQTRINALAGDLIGMAEALLVRFSVDLEGFQWEQLIDFSALTPAITAGIGTFVSFLSNTVLVLLFMLFILAGSGDLSQKVRTAWPESYAVRFATLIQNIDTQVRQYLLTKTLVSLATGALTWLILLILGIDSPIIWGFLAFLLNYIPNIGSLIAVFFPFVWSMLLFPDMTRPLLVLLCLGVTQGVMGNVVEPRIMAFSLNLSPLFVLVSLIFWGWLWGLWGMVLAVPLTATIKIIFENLEPLRPVSVLMSDASR